MSTLTNENCLEGIACPRCLQEDVFDIAAMASFLVRDDGTDEYSSVEWDETSPITCGLCDYDGQVADFTVSHWQECEKREGFVWLSVGEDDIQDCPDCKGIGRIPPPEDIANEPEPQEPRPETQDLKTYGSPTHCQGCDTDCDGERRCKPYIVTWDACELTQMEFEDCDGPERVYYCASCIERIEAEGTIQGFAFDSVVLENEAEPWQFGVDTFENKDATESGIESFCYGEIENVIGSHCIMGPDRKTYAIDVHVHLVEQ